MIDEKETDAQGFGSAMTYARRYSLSAAFGVAPEDDDGNAATKNPPVVKNIAQNTDQEVAFAKLPPEAIKALQLEAKAIEGDFYTLGTKHAVSRYDAFKKDANGEEISGLWSFLDSKVRNGMKRFAEGVA